MRRLKILHLHQANEWGGNLAGTFLVCRGLVEWGHQVFLAAPSHGVGLDRFQRAGVTFLPFRARSKWDLPAAWRLAKLIKKHEIEIVHSHLRPLDWLCFLARPWARAVWLTTIHGFDVALDPMTFRPQGGFKNALYRLALRRGFDRVLTVSKHLAKDAVARLGLDPLKVVHVINGIELPPLPRPGLREESRQRLGLGPAEVAAVVVGAITHRKGQLRLIELAAPILSSGRLRLILVGQGDELAACRAKVAELGLAGRVILTGFQADVTPYLAAADLALLPSLSEGLPRSLMEAMAWGLPVLASDLEGIRELIGPGQGLLVPPDDRQAWLEALIKLADDPLLRQSLGEAGRKRVADQFSVQAMLARHLAIYQAAWREARIVAPDQTGLGSPEVRRRKAKKLARRLLKRRLEGLVYASAGRLLSPRPLPRPSQPGRVALIYRGMALGDLAVCTPLTRGLKQAFPGVRIALLLPQRLIEAARADTCVDLIVPYPDRERGHLAWAWRAIASLRGFKPEIAISLGLPFTTALVTRLSGAVYTLGYNYNHRAFLLHERPQPHLAHHRSGWEYGPEDQVPYAAESWARLLTRLTGPVELSWSHLDLKQASQETLTILNELGIQPSETIIALNPRAAQENRSLKFSQAAYLAQGLSRLGRVVITGGPGQAEFCCRLAEQTGRGAVNLAGRLNLAQSWALTRFCRLVVSVDTGFGHLAAGLGRPVITLFTQGDHLLWAPYKCRHLAVFGDESCVRCKSGRCSQASLLCLESLDLDRALELAAQEVQEPRPRRRAGGRPRSAGAG